jgi:hypothetical protein
MANNEDNWGEFSMLTQMNTRIGTEKETTMAFNMGLQTAIYVLEKAETLSAEGRRLLIEELKKQITCSEEMKDY